MFGRPPVPPPVLLTVIETDDMHLVVLGTNGYPICEPVHVHSLGLDINAPERVNASLVLGAIATVIQDQARRLRAVDN